jgi:hypothetical protein
VNIQSSRAYEDAVRDGAEAAYLDSVGVSVELPNSIKTLGCVNCRVGDRLRHPEFKHLYCCGCPVRRSERTTPGGVSYDLDPEIAEGR